MFPFRFQQNTHQHTHQHVADATQRDERPFLPWQQDDAQRRLDTMERDEPKRRLIRDAKALAKQRKITQVRMAEELGVPHRTLEEWLQFRRMPKAPGATLLRRWFAAYSQET